MPAGRLFLSVILSALLWSFYGQAQTDTIKQGDTTKTAEQEGYILVVPFSSKMYQCNGDIFICKEGNMTPGELADVIRRSLSSTMAKNLSVYYNEKELDDLDLNDPTNDYNRIYELVQYKTGTRAIKAFYKGYPSFTVNKVVGASNGRWGSDCISGSKAKPDRRYHAYSKVVITNDSLFNNFCSKYQAAYVLFINRFEMFTRFKNCLDLQQNVFQRDIFLTYTLVDNTGSYKDGGVVGTTFQSGTNNIQEIGNVNFGLLTSLIVDLVRKNL